MLKAHKMINDLLKAEEILKAYSELKADEIETIPTTSSFGNVSGVVVRTTKKIYVIDKNTKNNITVYQLKNETFNNEYKWERYYNVNTKTMKGCSGLPKKVIEKIKQLA